MASAVRWPCTTAVLCLWLAATLSPVHARSSGAGRIKAVVGTASIVREGHTKQAVVGGLVYESDVLRTGSNGQLSVMLRDESRLAIGPNSELTLSAFAYAPSEGRLALAVRMARGALSYISGRIAALMPEAVKLETPSSVIGVRGTHALVKVDAP
jgi:hypothetical protein